MTETTLSLEYKPGLADVVERHRRLWTRQMPDGILARIDPAEIPFTDPLQFCPDIPAMAAAWEQNYRARKDVEDDLIPVARVSFGSAAFAAFLGAEILFDGGAGWCRPLINDYSQLDDLAFDEQNEWIQRQLEACRFFVQAAQGKFALCETEPMDGLNLVEGLRGSAAYTDLYDHPAEVHRLLDFAVRINIRLIEMQRAILQPCQVYQGGNFSMFRIWLPGQAVWMSVDAYGLCAPPVFRKFGAPYLQRTIDHFSGGWIHLHSTSLHLLPELALLDQKQGAHPSLLGLNIYDDPNGPRALSQLKRIRQIVGDIPLQVDCRADELQQGLVDHTLPGGVMYMVKSGVHTIHQANRLMEQVRAYRAP
jgi:hypothetical protein